MKRYASFALALLLVLSIGVVPARADTNPGAVRPAETVTEGGVDITGSRTSGNLYISRRRAATGYQKITALRRTWYLTIKHFSGMSTVT